MRWDHPTRGTLTPDAFVPSAEELGLIDQVDRIVIAKTSNTTTMATRIPTTFQSIRYFLGHI